MFFLAFPRVFYGFWMQETDCWAWKGFFGCGVIGWLIAGTTAQVPVVSRSIVSMGF